MRPRVIHLVDDCTAGGVMQVVKFLTTSADHAAYAEHRSMQVTRGAILPPRIDADVIVSHLALSWRTLPAVLALRLRYPKCHLIHVEHSYTEGFTRHNVGNLGRFETMLRLSFSIFDHVLAVSEGQMDWLRRRTLLTSKKLGLARSYCDLTPFLGVPEAKGPIKRFGAIGRLDRQKGFDSLIEAFRQTTDPQYTLTFFGVGDAKAELVKLAQGDDRIHFSGFANDPRDAYSAVDAVIMPSRWEAYGLVALEALCAGRTLLCTTVDGLSDHLRHGAIPIGTIDSTIFEITHPAWMPRPARTELAKQLLRENTIAWQKAIKHM